MARRETTAAANPLIKSMVIDPSTALGGARKYNREKTVNRALKKQ